MFDADDDRACSHEARGATSCTDGCAVVDARGGADGRGGAATEHCVFLCQVSHEPYVPAGHQLAAARVSVVPRAHEGGGSRRGGRSDRSTSRSALRAEDVSARLPKCASAAGLSDQPSGVRNAESASSPIPIAPAVLAVARLVAGVPAREGHRIRPTKTRERAVFACAGAGSSPSREKTLTSRTRRVLRQGASEARRSRPPPRHREDDPRARQPQPHHRPRRGAGGRRSRLRRAVRGP